MLPSGPSDSAFTQRGVKPRAEGKLDSEFVGSTVGKTVQCSVANSVGFAVGSSVERVVGNTVGKVVGIDVRTSVGDHVGVSGEVVEEKLCSWIFSKRVEIVDEVVVRLLKDSTIKEEVGICAGELVGIVVEFEVGDATVA